MPSTTHRPATLILFSLAVFCMRATSWAAEAPSPAADPAAWAPPLYAFCVELGAAGVAPRALAEEARMLSELGYEGGGYPLWLGPELDKNLEVLDRAGQKLFLAYTTVDLNNTARPYDPRLADALPKLKGRPVTISVLLVGLRPGDAKGMEPAVKILRELGDLAAKSDLRISIYHHVDNWTEALPFALDVVKKVDHPRVGVNFNLCHWLKIEGDKDYRALVREHGNKIFAVTISGAQRGAATWTNGLIQPLDRGDFDNRALLAVLRDAGYRGPIGLMCYGVPDKAEDHLARSRKVWKQWLRHAQ